MVDDAFKEMKFSDYVVIAFSKHAEDLCRRGCEVMGVFVDSQLIHLGGINMPRKEGIWGHLNSPLLTDVSRSLSQDYGVLKEDWRHWYRGLIITDDRSVLHQITVNNLPVVHSVEDIPAPGPGLPAQEWAWISLSSTAMSRGMSVLLAGSQEATQSSPTWTTALP